MKHTPLPWEVNAMAVPEIRKGRHRIARTLLNLGSESLPEAEANAQFIVKACNEYYQNQETIKELVEALSLTIRTVNDALRHGLTEGQIEALDDCVKGSNKLIKRCRQ